MFCKFCGTQMNDGDLFCPNCGKQQRNESGSASSASPTSAAQQSASTTQTAQPQPTAQPQVQATAYVAKKSNAGVIGAVVGVVVVAAVLLGYMFVIKPQQEAKRIAEMQRLEAQRKEEMQRIVEQRIEETKQKTVTYLRELANKYQAPHINEVADAVIREGINTIVKNNFPPIFYVAMSGNVELTKLLLDSGANINLRLENGTPIFITLMDFIEDGYGYEISADTVYKILQLLIDDGADVNARDNYGDTAIAYAVSIGDIQIIKLFLDAGADVHARDSYGDTAITYAKDAQIWQLLRNAEEAVTLQQIADTKRKVEMYLRELASTHQEATALNELAEAVIQEGLNAKSNIGSTALMWGAQYNNMNVVKSLIDTRVSINVKNNYGQTALMYAAWQNNIDIAKLLISAGANMNVKDNNGWTALGIAEYYGYTQIAQLLRNAGATY